MKVAASFVLFNSRTFVFGSKTEKKVPPRHPLQRLKRLNQFATEWIHDNLPAKVANHWTPKFERNTARFERRFVICPFYKPEHGQHGGIVRRETNEEEDQDDDQELLRYDKTNPVRGMSMLYMYWYIKAWIYEREGRLLVQY